MYEPCYYTHGERSIHATNTYIARGVCMNLDYYTHDEISIHATNTYIARGVCMNLATIRMAK